MNQSLLEKYTLSPIRPITWDEIHSKWKKREEKIWHEHYTSKGYNSWES